MATAGKDGFDFRTDPPLIEFEFRLSRFTDGISDWGGMFERIGHVFIKQQKRHFATEGAAGSGRWTKLTKKYAAWKQAHYPGQKIGHLTGALRASMTGGSGYSQTIGKTSASFGMDSSSKAEPYGAYFSALRPVIVATAYRGQEIQQSAVAWVREEAHHSGLIGAMSGSANKPLPSTDYVASLPST